MRKKKKTKESHRKFQDNRWLPNTSLPIYQLIRFCFSVFSVYVSFDTTYDNDLLVD